MVKQCNRCKETKDISEFFPRSDRKNAFIPYCKLCKRENDRRYNKNRKPESKRINLEKRKLRMETIRNWLYDRLRQKGCKDCGENDIVVLEFHHIENKKYTISHMLRSKMSLDNLKSEVEKCEVVCANCHRRRTAKQFNWYKQRI